MIWLWLVLGLSLGVLLSVAALLVYNDRLPEEEPAPNPMLALQEVNRLRSQTVREMVSAERQVYVPARRYWAVIDGQLVERTVSVGDVEVGR